MHHRQITPNSPEDGRVSWPLLMLLCCVLGLPFGLGFLLTSRAAISVQVQPPILTNQPPLLKMVQPRWGHTATVLPDGRVYIEGGYKTAPVPGIADPEPAELREVFDPLTMMFSQATAADDQAAQSVSLGPLAEIQAGIDLANTFELLFGIQGATMNGGALTAQWDPNAALLQRAYATATTLDGTRTVNGETQIYDFNQHRHCCRNRRTTLDINWTCRPIECYRSDRPRIRKPHLRRHSRILSYRRQIKRHT